MPDAKTTMASNNAEDKKSQPTFDVSFTPDELAAWFLLVSPKFAAVAEACVTNAVDGKTIAGMRHLQLTHYFKIHDLQALRILTEIKGATGTNPP